VDASELADWITRGFDDEWKSRAARLASVSEAVTLLSPSPAVTRYLCVPVGQWTALLSNGPLGTDVGVLPSYAARELGCRALRVVSIDDSATYPAQMLEVYGPGGEPPLSLERSIVAADDGGRWVFETSGTPYPFEDQSMLHDYLRALGVPVDASPDWQRAVVVERSS
jgi:hypothetical protein